MNGAISQTINLTCPAARVSDVLAPATATNEGGKHMPIENRSLEVGTCLVASYKKQAYVCRVEAAEGEGIAFVLEDGKRFKSPSSAGSAVMGGKAVNGWRFWSLEGTEPAAKAEAAGAEKPKPKSSKAKKLIYRIPNQQGLATGKAKFFCTACMKSFLVDAGGTPEVCPEGHRIDDPELTAPVASEATE